MREKTNTYSEACNLLYGAQVTGEQGILKGLCQKAQEGERSRPFRDPAKQFVERVPIHRAARRGHAPRRFGIAEVCLGRGSTADNSGSTLLGSLQTYFLTGGSFGYPRRIYVPFHQKLLKFVRFVYHSVHV